MTCRKYRMLTAKLCKTGKQVSFPPTSSNTQLSFPTKSIVLMHSHLRQKQLQPDRPGCSWYCNPGITRNSSRFWPDTTESDQGNYIHGFLHYTTVLIYCSCKLPWHTHQSTALFSKLHLELLSQVLMYLDEPKVGKNERVKVLVSNKNRRGC